MSAAPGRGAEEAVGAEMAEDAVLGVGRGGLRAERPEGGVGVAHGDGSGAKAHHARVVEVVPEDDGLVGAEPAPGQKGAQGVGLVHAGGLDVDPLRAGEDDAQIRPGQGGEARQKRLGGLGMEDGHLADPAAQHLPQGVPGLAGGEELPDLGPVLGVRVAHPGARGAAKDGRGPRGGERGAEDVPEEGCGGQILEEGPRLPRPGGERAVLGDEVDGRADGVEAGAQVRQLAAAGDGPGHAAPGQRADKRPEMAWQAPRAVEQRAIHVGDDEAEVHGRHCSKPQTRRPRRRAREDKRVLEISSGHLVRILTGCGMSARLCPEIGKKQRGDVMVDTETTYAPLSGSLQMEADIVPIEAFDSYPATTSTIIEVNVLGAAEPIFLPGNEIKKTAMVCRILAKNVPAGVTLVPGAEVVVRLTRNGVTTVHDCLIAKNAEASVTKDGESCAAVLLTLQPIE